MLITHNHFREIVKNTTFIVLFFMFILTKNGKWRVCIDFTDLNKSCPKDPFPLPHIDKLVDATAGHQLMTFMDAFVGTEIRTVNFRLN